MMDFRTNIVSDQGERMMFHGPIPTGRGKYDADTDYPGQGAKKYRPVGTPAKAGRTQVGFQSELRLDSVRKFTSGPQIPTGRGKTDAGTG